MCASKASGPMKLPGTALWDISYLHKDVFYLQNKPLKFILRNLILGKFSKLSNRDFYASLAMWTNKAINWLCQVCTINKPVWGVARRVSNIKLHTINHYISNALILVRSSTKFLGIFVCKHTILIQL